MKKVVGAVVLALVAGLLLATPTAQGARRTAPAAAYEPPPIEWGECADPLLQDYGAECGELIVPMDYAKPDGKQIRLAVSRMMHTSSEENYQGVMLVNPGGPGGSGQIYSIIQTWVPNGAGGYYDWIGFDPRGVGSSTPALACDRRYFKGDRPPYVPSTDALMDRWVDRSKGYAADCKDAKHSALFDHVKTTDSVKDVESLRKALGEDQINWYGFSYGTYLGSVYATRHPDRVRRFVFDGTMNPTQTYYESNQGQDIAFEKTINTYFGWLAKYRKVYHVGKTKAAVRKRYFETVDRLDRHAERGILGGDELSDVFLAPGYYVFGYTDVAEAYSTYLNDGKPRKLIRLYSGANSTAPGADNWFAMYLGTQCTDAPWPRNQAKLNRDNWALHEDHPFFTWGNAWFNGPCAYWPWDNDKPPVVDGAQVEVPILMIGETSDAATPFEGSLVVRKLFPTASLIEGKNGTTHAGSLSGVPCTDDAIAAYLEDGTVPERLSGRRADLVCPPVPKPDPTAPGRADKRSAILDELRLRSVRTFR